MSLILMSSALAGLLASKLLMLMHPVRVSEIIKVFHIPFCHLSLRHVNDP
jgi:hypothetical protein